MSTHNRYSALDAFLIELQNAVLRPRSAKPDENDLQVPALSDDEKKLSASLMRINHTGEVCAQALYLGQAFVARDEKTREHLLQAAKEEAQHLDWCAERVMELNSHTSALNVAWFSLSVLTGMLAGLTSDQLSLGFIAETEKQVAAHLEKHLQRLPSHDKKSRDIITQMRQDEIKHQTDALNAGGIELPKSIKLMMKLSAKVMTQTAHYI